MPSSAFTLSRFQPQDGSKRRPVCRVGRLATLLIASVLAIGSTPEPGDAGLWDDVKELYFVFRLGEVDEASIPQTPVEYIGEIGLNFQGEVELAFDGDTPGIGRVRWMEVTPEGSLLLTDEIGCQALEFSLQDGRYIRAFGRRGNGPGEYVYTANMAVGPQGQIYLLSSYGVLCYDRQGQYLERKSSLSTSWVLTGRGGEIFLLRSNAMRILELQRRDPATWEVLYRTPLSNDKQQFISHRLRYFAQLCYSAGRHRLYYLGPNDYFVKEIDAETGEIIRQFGLRPEGFIPLPKRYQSIGRGSRKDMNELLLQIQMSRVKSMTLLQDRYLLVSYKIAHSWEGIIYDLNSASVVETRAYGFNEKAKERLKMLSLYIPWNSITAWDDQLYIWREPSEGVSETSNGTVELYTLSFNAN